MILLGREMYRDGADLLERGFPNLLAMKRILDGEAPSNSVLQGKRAAAVRRELTDSDDLNSAYFDLIVGEFDRSIRNAIAHGDLLTDTAREEVRIPTSGRTYSYRSFADAVTAHLVNVVFLTGAFSSLVEWNYYAAGDGDLVRDGLGR